ncbi:MAG: hypothetical protein SPJ29_03740 [Phocaeicola sp.]|nr:hypothetical protein [Phocaeicola sp.]
MKKQKEKKPDGRRATCPRWDRWHVRIPKPEDQKKVIELFRKSGATSRSDFLRARLLGDSFKVITEDPSAGLYLERLSQIVEVTRKFGILYNEVVKVINTYHSVATAQKMLQKLETYSEALIRLQKQTIQITIEYQAQDKV